MCFIMGNAALVQQPVQIIMTAFRLFPVHTAKRAMEIVQARVHAPPGQLLVPRFMIRFVDVMELHIPMNVKPRYRV
jgi:hypothetical protein